MTTVSTLRAHFTPSSTGLPHVGDARDALCSRPFVRRTGGEFLIRIEDPQLERSETRFETRIVEDPRWPDVDWGVCVLGVRDRIEQIVRV
ncbi:MAG: glutamate--tRNA ligase family protein [Terracidiphilus sp.]